MRCVVIRMRRLVGSWNQKSILPLGPTSSGSPRTTSEPLF